MIDPKLQRDLFKRKYDGVMGARRAVMLKVAHFGMVRKTDEDMWDDFTAAGPAGLQRAQTELKGEDFTDYLRTLTRIAGKRGGLAPGLLGAVKEAAGVSGGP